MNKTLLVASSFSGGIILGFYLFPKVLTAMLHDEKYMKEKLGPKINNAIKSRVGEEKYCKILEILSEK